MDQTAWYSTIRYVPDLVKEEFVNVGVLLVCPERGFYELRRLPRVSRATGKLRSYPDADGMFIQAALQRLAQAVEDKTSFSPPGGTKSPADTPLYRLIGAYQNNLRLSSARSILTEDPRLTLDQLYSELVMTPEPARSGKRMNRTEMRRHAHKVFAQQGLFHDFPDLVQEDLRPPIPASTSIDLAYRNGAYHFFQLIPAFTDDEGRRDVNSYRTMARDLRQSHVPVPFRNAAFSVVTAGVVQNEQESEIQHVLSSEDIRTIVMQDLQRVARDIRSDLGDRLRLQDKG